jgi:hypothetical protein
MGSHCGRWCQQHGSYGVGHTGTIVACWGALRLVPPRNYLIDAPHCDCDHGGRRPPAPRRTRGRWRTRLVARGIARPALAPPACSHGPQRYFPAVRSTSYGESYPPWKRAACKEYDFTAHGWPPVSEWEALCLLAGHEHRAAVHLPGTRRLVPHHRSRLDLRRLGRLGRLDSF